MIKIVLFSDRENIFPYLKARDFSLIHQKIYTNREITFKKESLAVRDSSQEQVGFTSKFNEKEHYLVDVTRNSM